MKKLVLISVLLLTLSLNKTMAQFEISANVVKYGIDAGNVSDFGYGFGIQLKKVLIDVSFNTAKGKGDYLEFSSDRTYPIDKKMVGCINIGYNVLPSNKYLLMPTIGVAWTTIIYQDPIGWDTYYTQKGNDYVNLGLVFKCYPYEHLGLSIGIGTVEQLKAGIGFKF